MNREYAEKARKTFKEMHIISKLNTNKLICEHISCFLPKYGRNIVVLFHLI